MLHEALDQNQFHSLDIEDFSKYIYGVLHHGYVVMDLLDARLVNSISTT